jgi:hypothetical protein
MLGDGRILLAYGLSRGGKSHEHAVLRPLTGADEILLAETRALPAVRATMLLAATVQAIGSIAPIERDHVRDLTIGDRERLLLGLYGLSFGPLVDTILNCPNCREIVELPLDLDFVLARSAGPPRTSEHSLTIGPVTLQFRLPTGADHERAAKMALVDPARAATDLCAACIMGPSHGTVDVSAERMPDEVQAALEEELRRLEPAAEITIGADCPACGATVGGTLDGLSLLAGQLGPLGAVLGDVDRVARAYHWSEAEILALPTVRRRRYLALLDRAAAA